MYSPAVETERVFAPVRGADDPQFFGWKGADVEGTATAFHYEDDSDALSAVVEMFRPQPNSADNSTNGQDSNHS